MKEGEGGHWRTIETGHSPGSLCPAWEPHVTFWVGYSGCLGAGPGRVGRLLVGEGSVHGPGSLTVSPCFCSEGSNLTPAHHFQDFRFKTYAPVAFRYFPGFLGFGQMTTW